MLYICNVRIRVNREKELEKNQALYELSLERSSVEIDGS